MDQKKIGAFMKNLRKEKGITQETLAQNLGVSNRTVSRWETGFNMPDLDLLIELADYFGVEIKEILDGERKSDTMNKEMEETVLKVADYSNHEKQRLARRMCGLFILGTICFIIYLVLDATDLINTPTWMAVEDMSLGGAFGIMMCGVLYTSGLMTRFSAFKRRLLKRQ